MASFVHKPVSLWGRLRAVLSPKHMTMSVFLMCAAVDVDTVIKRDVLGTFDPIAHAKKSTLDDMIFSDISSEEDMVDAGIYGFPPGRRISSHHTVASAGGDSATVDRSDVPKPQRAKKPWAGSRMKQWLKSGKMQI